MAAAIVAVTAMVDTGCTIFFITRPL
jgi:hypothetical protein